MSAVVEVEVFMYIIYRLLKCKFLFHTNFNPNIINLLAKCESKYTHFTYLTGYMLL